MRSGAADTGVNLTGTLNGMGHGITAAFGASNYNNSGLFNVLDGGTVKNLSVTATYGTLTGIPQGGWNLYRFGALGIEGKYAVIENCFIRTSFTKEAEGNHGMAGLVGYGSNTVNVRGTIVAVSAPADAENIYGIVSTSAWNGFYTLQNVLVYTSGGNVAAVGTNGELTEASENYQAFTGGLNGPAAEAAREDLLAKAEELGMSDFVQAQFTAADLLLDKASVAITADVTTVVERSTITLQATATDLTTNTPIAAENIVWETDKPAVATVENGVVTGVSAGAAVITATVTVGGKSYSASVTVTVEELVTASISFDEGNPAQVGVGSSITLSVTAKNLLDGEEISADNITWASKDETKATVEKGVVTAKPRATW